MCIYIYAAVNVHDIYLILKIIIKYINQQTPLAFRTRVPGWSRIDPGLALTLLGYPPLP